MCRCMGRIDKGHCRGAARSRPSCTGSTRRHPRRCSAVPGNGSQGSWPKTERKSVAVAASTGLDSSLRAALSAMRQASRTAARRIGLHMREEAEHNLSRSRNGKRAGPLDSSQAPFSQAPGRGNWLGDLAAVHRGSMLRKISRIPDRFIRPKIERHDPFPRRMLAATIFRSPRVHGRH